MAERALSQDIIDSSGSVTVLSGAQLSDAFDCAGMSLIGLILPSALTSTALTIKASSTLGGTYNDVYNSSGSQFSVTVAASRFVSFSPSDFAALRYIKLNMGTAEGADRVIGLVVRALK